MGGHSGGTVRVQWGYSEGTVGYRGGTVRVQWGYSEGTVRYRGGTVRVQITQSPLPKGGGNILG